MRGTLEKFSLFLSRAPLLHPKPSSSCIPLKATTGTTSVEVSTGFIPMKLCVNVVERTRVTLRNSFPKRIKDVKILLTPPSHLAGESSLPVPSSLPLAGSRLSLLPRAGPEVFPSKSTREQHALPQEEDKDWPNFWPLCSRSLQLWNPARPPLRTKGPSLPDLET